MVDVTLPELGDAAAISDSDLLILRQGADTVDLKGTALQLKTYIGALTSVGWGDIGGTLSDQTDLQTALDAKASLTGAETITNKTIVITDTLFTLQDDVTPTKQARFNCSNISAATTRTYNLPNLNANLAHVDNSAQTFSGQCTWTNATLSLGTPATASTVNIGTGATTTGLTKTLNFGAAGLSGSTTNINLGSTVSGALGTITINTPTVTFAASTTAINVNYLTASSLVATDASKKLISVPLVPTSITVAAETLDSQCFAGFFTTTSGDLEPKTINAIRADATTGDFYTQGSASTRTARLGGDGYGYFRYDDNSSKYTLKLENRNISLGANGGVGLEFNLADDTTTTAITAGRISCHKEGVWTTTTSTQDAYFLFSVATDGTSTGKMRLYGSGALTPNANDGTALGTTSLSWSDLFLASGGVINFNNGNVVMTHSSGILTMGTGDLRVTNAGTNAASVVTVQGTQALTNKSVNGVTLTTAGTLLTSYTVGTVPSASGSGAGFTIYVSNETGGAVPAFSDGTNWRRVTDRAIIS